MNNRAIKKGGRPSFEPSTAQRTIVTAMVAVGTRLDLVARHLGIDRKTLSRHFRKEITQAKGDAVAMVARSLFQSAIGGNLGAQIFFLKTQGRWKETNALELTGPDGEPIVPEAAPSMHDLFRTVRFVKANRAAVESVESINTEPRPMRSVPVVQVVEAELVPSKLQYPVVSRPAPPPRGIKPDPKNESKDTRKVDWARLAE